MGISKSLAALKCKGHNGDFLLAIGTQYVNPLTQSHSLLLGHTDPLLRDEKKEKKGKDCERKTVTRIY